MAECGHCRDCKWWDPDENNIWGDCLKAQEYEMRDQDRSKAMAKNPGKWGGLAFLETFYDFGCIQFEAKPQPST